MYQYARLFHPKTVALISSFLIGVCLSPLAKAEMPVIDIASIAKTGETISQLKDQYYLQQRQFANMEQNTKALSSYNFGTVDADMDKLLRDINTLEQYKGKYGSTDNYLAQYNDLKFYQEKCSKGCSQAQWQKLKEIESLWFEAQKKSNDAMLRNVDTQQKSLNIDQKTLRDLQNSTRNAKGQMESIQNTNQLASYQSQQMLQIRGLLIAQQNAQATRAQAEANRKAIEAAADKRILSGTFKKSTDRSW